MMELQKRYIQNQIFSLPMKISHELSNNNQKFNKRSHYYKIIRYIDDYIEMNNINRFLVLPGLRDVGKSTLLFQVYDYLLNEKNISPQNILYFSCDRLKK